MIQIFLKLDLILDYRICDMATAEPFKYYSVLIDCSYVHGIIIDKLNIFKKFKIGRSLYLR